MRNRTNRDEARADAPQRAITVRNYGFTDHDFAGLVGIWEAQWERPAMKRIWGHLYPNGWNVHDGLREFRPMLEKDPAYVDREFLVAEMDEPLPGEGARLAGFVLGCSLESMVDAEVPHLGQSFRSRGLLSRNEPSFYQRDIFAHPTRIIDRDTGLPPLQLLFGAFLDRLSDKGYRRIVTRTPPFNKLGVRAFMSALHYGELFADSSPERRYFVRSTGPVSGEALRRSPLRAAG